VRAPDALAKYIAPKGSAALDGVSLTVNEVRGSVFTINLIPATLDITTWGEKKPGDAVNLEVDLIARYVARLLGQ
jgi:riboflavin synthase